MKKICLIITLFLHSLWSLSANDIEITAYAPIHPILKGLDVNPFIKITITIPESSESLKNPVFLATTSESSLSWIESIGIYDGSQTLLKQIKIQQQQFELHLDTILSGGSHEFILGLNPNGFAPITGSFEMHCHTVIFDQNIKIAVRETGGNFVKKIGSVIRKYGDEGVHTYRIPGLITTQKGTLIAVYDIRYTTSRDLPGNIDVGMNRSTDGGNTWEPMNIIMDMGSPHENNGVGDPTILFDPATNRIWVAALWSKGNRSIAGSGPGISPDETGQLVLTYSDDDGLTWADVYSITPEVKDPKWNLFFQGPGAGIAMKDGTLVIPTQYWSEDKIPFSNLIYSKDQGKTWKTSEIAPKSNTTESQVVETSPGTLMLNMRDNRGRFRSISTTMDFGTSWNEHPTSRNALPDPICQGSIIKTALDNREILLFCNLNTSSKKRENMTLKASLDLGESWPAKFHYLFDERETFGYSSISMVDQNTIGILYEGIRNIYFVQIPLNEVIR
jgi:sialidase-1